MPLFTVLEAAGIPPASVVLAWTFKINDLPVVVFQPSAAPPQVPLPNDLAIDPRTASGSAAKRHPYGSATGGSQRIVAMLTKLCR